MGSPLSDDELIRWAREHLVYEARMLAFTAVRLAERHGIPRDPESNALLESFAIHVRCLRDFLWGERKPQYPTDAFASDFCEADEWERERGPVPPALEDLDSRRRAGREVVHLSYGRLTVQGATKDWNVGAIYAEIADALELLATTAIVSRMDQKTRDALEDPMAHHRGIGPASVATGAIYGQAIQGATITFPGFHAGS